MDELTRSLLTIVSDPDHVAQLYSQLRQFCHDTRNELSVYRMKLYMARRDAESASRIGDLTLAESRYRDLERFVVTIQTICRPMNPAPIPVALDVILEDFRRRWVEDLRRGGRILAWTSSIGSMEAQIDFLLLGEAFDSFVTWRAESGPRPGSFSVVCSATRDDLRLSWRECGDDVQRPVTALPNLALVHLGRVVSAHRGTISVDDRDGLNVEITLPLRVQTASTSATGIPGLPHVLDARRSVGNLASSPHGEKSTPRTSQVPSWHPEPELLALTKPRQRAEGIAPELD